jgi:hypothetical protein
MYSPVYCQTPPVQTCWSLCFPPSSQQYPEMTYRVVPSVHVQDGEQYVVTPPHVTYPWVVGQLRSTAVQVLGAV